jgi:hypothetical protein
MLTQLVGLAAALGLYVIGVAAYMPTLAARVNRLPSQWREHPDLRAGYDFMASLRFRDLLGQFRRRDMLGWLAWSAVGGGYLVAAGYSPRVEVLLCVTLATLTTYQHVADNRRRGERLASDLGLALPPRSRPGPARWAAVLVMSAGVVGAGCFAGGIVGAVIR